MRVLILGPKERQTIQRLVAYAQERDNWYDLDATAGKVPGEDPMHVAHIPDGFRCVFTISRKDGELLRHLSVSVPSENYPSPEACVELGKAFGFTASSDSLNVQERMLKDGWIVGLHQTEHCVVIVQPYK